MEVVEAENQISYEDFMVLPSVGHETQTWLMAVFKKNKNKFRVV